METNVSADVGSNITGLLEKLAVQLGTTVDKIYPLYVKQQVIEGYAFFGVCIVSLILLGIFAYIFREYEDSDGLKISYVVCGIISFLPLLFLLLGFSYNATKIYNPEYHAVQQIVKDVSSLSK